MRLPMLWVSKSARPLYLGEEALVFHMPGKVAYSMCILSKVCQKTKALRPLPLEDAHLAGLHGDHKSTSGPSRFLGRTIGSDSTMPDLTSLGWTQGTIHRGPRGPG